MLETQVSLRVVRSHTDRVKKLAPLDSHTFLSAASDGLVKEVGFYTVDRRQGNTGGLGGAFAFFYGVGRSLPFPEMHPYKPSKRYRLFQLIGKLQSKFSKKDE